MPLRHLLKNNANWVEQVLAEDPAFFTRLSKQQNPKYLWIGCSDSRVPANEIIGLLPGEVFVHRNIANLVVHTDLNCLSVLQYAVDVLQVEHVMVCGHYGCGGVRAAAGSDQLGLIDNWLLHIKDVRNKHRSELEQLPDPEAQVDRLCELNVLEQVLNVCSTTIVRNAWARNQPLMIHGLIYRLTDGFLKELGVQIACEADRLKLFEAR